jgi:hypothetical protein
MVRVADHPECMVRRFHAKEKSLKRRGATGIETPCLMNRLTGQVPYSTFLSSATRHLTSERLDLFLDDTLGPRSQSL